MDIRELLDPMPKCMDPVLCYDDGKSKKFRHYSLSTPHFKLIHNKVFDCGKCIFCRKKKSLELATRCVLHASLYKDNCFLTLTYDEKKSGYHNRFEYKDIQDFKKKLRRHCEYHHDKKIQIFNVHEYGKNGKKHWHLVVFNHDFSDKTLHTVSGDHRLYTSKTLEKLWPFGFNTIGSVTEASAMYQSQYMQKDIQNQNAQNDKKSHSKHSGIGRDYFLKHYEQILKLGYIPFNGKKLSVPRYFQKLAHKHYCHFYEPHYFFNNSIRQRLYAPFLKNEENRHIADLFIAFREKRKDFLLQHSAEWDAFIDASLFSTDDPDFLISGENFLYDLKNRSNNNTL